MSREPPLPPETGWACLAPGLGGIFLGDVRPMNNPGNHHGSSPFRKARRAGLPYPTPVVRPGDLNLTPVIKATVAGRVPPPPSHLPVMPPPTGGDPGRSLDVQMAANQQEELLLVFVSILLILLAGLFIGFGKFVAALLPATLAMLMFLASYYARRPRVTHRLARVLRAVFYKSFTYPGDTRPPRLSLRLSVIVIISILLGLFCHR